MKKKIRHKGIDDAINNGVKPKVLEGKEALRLIEKIAERAGVKDDKKDDRPKILISTEEHKINDQAVAALANDRRIYQRRGLLVRIVRDRSPVAKG
jgi:hypothetical protein